MLVSPIIERELRLALRKHKAVRSRFLVAVSGVAVVLFFLLIAWGAGFGSLIGGELHNILFYFGLMMAVGPPISITAGLFSEERRNQTMELLYLAGMKPGELFGGKLVSGTLAASTNLLALAPCLAVPFLCGGVSVNLFLATLGCFPVLLLFVIGVGVLASVLCKDEGTALFCAILIGGILCLATPLPYGMGKLLAGGPPFSVKWLALSPAFGPYLVAHHFDGHRPRVFWAACAVTLAWGALCAGTAALLLKRSWRAELARAGSTGWRANWEAWVYGDAGWRAGLREERLKFNPFEWLIEQDRRPAFAAWGIVGGLCAAWLAGWATWSRVWVSPTIFFATAMLMIVSVELVMSYAGARRLAHDRRDGVLELLLTTPLMPEQIVDGQLAGMKRLFQPVRKTVFVLCVVMALGGLLGRAWSVEALVSYGLIWAALLWWSVRDMSRSTAMAMWMGVNSARPAMAIYRRQNAWWWVAMMFNLRNLPMLLSRHSSINFPTGSVVELFIICSCAFILLIATAIARTTANRMRGRLIAELRSIAREPVPETNDPRFKKWAVGERLPRSAYHEMTERVASYPQRMADAQRARND